MLSETNCCLIHRYVLFCSKQYKALDKTLGELDGKVHRTLETEHENVRNDMK